MNNEIRQYLKQIESKGGQATARKYSKKQLTDWGKMGAQFGKLGGRPKKIQPKS
jgi:hypothetical protein